MIAILFITFGFIFIVGMLIGVLIGFVVGDKYYRTKNL